MSQSGIDYLQIKEYFSLRHVMPILMPPILRRSTLYIVASALLFIAVGLAEAEPQRRVLVLHEGLNAPSNIAQGDARQLAMLLGHFHVDYVLTGVESFD